MNPRWSVSRSVSNWATPAAMIFVLAPVVWSVSLHVQFDDAATKEQRAERLREMQQRARSFAADRKSVV